MPLNQDDSMSLFSRFFGRQDGSAADTTELVAKPGIENLSLIHI